MSHITGTTEYDEEDRYGRFGGMGSGNIDASTAVRTSDREDKDAIEGAQRIARDKIVSHKPSDSDSSLRGRVAKGAPLSIVKAETIAGQGDVSRNPAAPPSDIQDPSEAIPAEAPLTLEELPEELRAEVMEAMESNDRLSAMESDLATAQGALLDLDAQLRENPDSPVSDFPNLAWESVKACLAKERWTNDQLSKHIKEAEAHQKDIDLLLDLSAELTAYKEGSEMPENVKKLLAELKERGMDLWKNKDFSFDKEKSSALKGLAGAQVDNLRASVQGLFATKIQALIQAIGAIMEAFKEIIRKNDQLIRTALRIQGH